ncbi:hypothetical protein SHIRM173S_01305 [Streptomyces hirsutus]
MPNRPPSSSRSAVVSISGKPGGEALPRPGQDDRLAEPPGQRHMPRVVQSLPAEEHHLPAQHRRPDGGDHGVAGLVGEVDTGDLGTDVPGDRTHLDARTRPRVPLTSRAPPDAPRAVHVAPARGHACPLHRSVPGRCRFGCARVVRPGPPVRLIAGRPVGEAGERRHCQREGPLVISIPNHTLNDGTTIPAIGLGTWPMDDAQAEQSVAAALETGYRLVDTATNYHNETGVGRAVARAGVPREEVVVTTKLPGRHHGYEETLASFEESRARLGLEYVDLYLIHWPLPRVGKYVDSWKAMIKLREDGLVRSIGVSNFTPAHIERLEKETGVLPSVNQVELHPFFPQEELRSHHADKGVLVESWSPLGRGSQLLDDLAVAAVAEAHGVTPAQAVLRWHIQLGALPVPKSADPERQRANLDVFGFTLDDAQMRTLTDRAHRRIGGDPEVHEEF